MNAEAREMRGALRRPEPGCDAQVARAEAQARREAEMVAKDELIAELKAMLAEARRPWWRRWTG